MVRGWFYSLLISSHLEHYGKQVGELESQRLRSELCTDLLVTVTALKIVETSRSSRKAAGEAGDGRERGFISCS
jgi:hypothetical protein